MPSFKDKFTNIFKKNEPDDDDDEALLASDTLTATASRQANNFVSGAKSFMGIQDEEAQREPPGMMEELQQEVKTNYIENILQYLDLIPNNNLVTLIRKEN
eukprot:Pgem_evm1s2331